MTTKEMREAERARLREILYKEKQWAKLDGAMKWARHCRRKERPEILKILGGCLQSLTLQRIDAVIYAVYAPALRKHLSRPNPFLKMFKKKRGKKR